MLSKGEGEIFKLLSFMTLNNIPSSNTLYIRVGQQKCQILKLGSGGFVHQPNQYLVQYSISWLLSF